MKKTIFFSLALLFSAASFAQVGIGTTTPASSAILDLTSTNKGLLLPRVANTAAVSSPINGMMVFDLSSNCLKVYQNGAWSNCLQTSAPTVSAVCTGFVGSYCTSALSGTTYVVTLTNNDFAAKQVTPQIADLSLSGITGLSVSAVSPNTVTTINAGASLVVTYTISGTPDTAGTLTGTFSKQGLSCTSTVAVENARAVTAASATPTLCINTALTPITHTTTGATGIGTATGLPAGVTATWASNTLTISGTPTVAGTFNYSIPLIGNCGSPANATGTITVTPSLAVTEVSANPVIAINAIMTNVTHTTSGATGIGTATGLPAGVTAAWTNNTITISGTPTVLGTYNYIIPTNGVCGLNINATGTIIVAECGAYVAPGVYQVFMCHNLGADTSLDPNIPVQGLHGNYYQWGRSAVVADASTAAGAINEWNTTVADDSSWLDTEKTANDPCPTGFRVPTKDQWEGIGANNTIVTTGTWSDSSSNFGSAIHFGPNASTKTLTLPAAGYRYDGDGALFNRGAKGLYWSSTEYGTNASYFLFIGGSTNTTDLNRPYGFSVRCISE